MDKKFTPKSGVTSAQKKVYEKEASLARTKRQSNPVKNKVVMIQWLK